ncbi:hypothetical protein EJB05_18865 [Eragrostis curvula]|uniref:Plectin/eS10 N-terminal domain-containing protein n=1 Tax=Eragrostis curvula TaxID=38414 RepID=A0A5J9VPC8_9POAL|nr:hypothetical protein EJB05_18865 [Eragrostis curvula]
MIISKKNRREICKYLFHEGVLYAKKDYNLAKHPKLDVPNLEVIKLMQSFKSKEYVRETFSWQHYYWYLTNDGIEHLRSFLNLPSEVVPNTLKKSNKPPSRPFGSGPPGVRLALRVIDQGLGTGMVTGEARVVLQAISLVRKEVLLQSSSHLSGVAGLALAVVAVALLVLGDLPWSDSINSFSDATRKGHLLC